MAGDTTLRPAKTPPPAGARRTPWLTVLWHPQLARVGDVHALGPRTRISRLEPELAPPGGGKRAPLADPHLSRSAIVLAMRPDGALDVDAPAAAELVIDGAPVAGRALISGHALAHGAVLELAGRVALLVHLRRAPAADAARGDAMVGASEELDALRTELARLASVAAPVLIVGETGAGKERIARALHERSPRAAGPFVAINMATLASGTAAAQLFGHARGAFTGADRAVPGLFAQADGGTLFLDEVFDTPAEVQPMLLRALDAGEILPLGADGARRVDVRILAATDANLVEAASRGEFRAQLYHRLAGHRVTAPPLRARVDDIGRLLAAFVARELPAPPDTKEPWLPTPAIAACVRHAWPGNVRELGNVARRLAVLGARGAIALPDALAAIRGGEAAGAAPIATPRVDLRDDAQLLAALAAHRWQPGAAATALGISKTTLYAWMDRCPAIRKAGALPRADIAAAYVAAAGDLDSMSEALRVSRRGLQLRMRELGMTGAT